MHVIATAGHVDHGKSTLIRALTGMEPDRWAEERRRGMTIDLGYAWTTLADGNDVAFVDVPGHQRFITNMLAGIGPVPAVLFVVAADEGWRRQSGEHLRALDALDVRHGVLAVTRSDLGAAESATAEAREQMAGTSLDGIEAVAVSPVTDQGMDDLRGALIRMTVGLPASSAPTAPSVAPTRLWVDRVFTMRGAGTVVTGTLGSGRIGADDELVVVSSGERMRVRSLETLKRPADSASAVARVAINLRGVKRTDIQRGDALVSAGDWAAVTSVDVRLMKLSAKPPAQVIVHVGSAAVAARVRQFDQDTARLTWDGPLPLHVGERLILRDPGPQQVIAGAVVLDVAPPVLRRRGAAAVRAGELAVMTASPGVEAELARRGFAHRSGLHAAGILAAGAAGPPDAVAIGDWLVDPATWTEWRAQLRAHLANWTTGHPLTVGMPRPAVVAALALPDPGLLEPLVARDPELTSDHEGVHRVAAAVALPASVRQALDELRSRLRADPFDAAESGQLAAAGLTERYLGIATKNGELMRIAPGIYLLPDAPEQAAERLSGLGDAFTLSEARQALDTTRRVAVPLLELLDRRQVTVRVDAQRRSLSGRG